MEGRESVFPITNH